MSVVNLYTSYFIVYSNKDIPHNMEVCRCRYLLVSPKTLIVYTCSTQYESEELT